MTPIVSSRVVPIGPGRRGVALLLALVCRRTAAEAQQRRWRIGNVTIGGGTDTLIVERLSSLGYVDGRDVSFVHRVLPGPERADETLRDLVPLVDLIAVWSTIGALATRRATSRLPVVFLSVGDPVAVGLVESLAHPGGNMTGITFEATMSTYGKRLQMLREIVPDLHRLGVLRTRGDANVAPAMASLAPDARAMGIEIYPVDFSSVGDLEGAFGELRRAKADAVLVIAGARTLAYRNQIASLALSHRLPSTHGFTQAVEAGGLICVAPDYNEMARQGAAMIGKIMAGVRPADIPVEQPTRFDIWINLRTADALGVIVPPPLLAGADRVID